MVISSAINPAGLEPTGFAAQRGILPTGLPLLCRGSAGLAEQRFGPLAAGRLVLICLLVRWMIAAIAEYTCLRGNLPGRYLMLLPLKDICSFGLWLGSFLGDTVNWKGRRYRVLPDGRLEKVKEA